MPQHDDETADDGLVVVLASGATIREAAAQTGISASTITRRLADAGFKKRVLEARAALFSVAAGKLADSMSAAAAKLRDLLGSASEGIALRAATAIIDHSLRVVELVELQQRIEELERAVSRAEK